MTQESKALDYFNSQNETNHAKVISQIISLRENKSIQYKETGTATYEVIFNLP